MNKITLKVPKGIRRLTQWKNLDKILPTNGKFIVNKLLTGCGFTYKYLTDETPVILLSPRLELIHSKEHLQNVFYFKNTTVSERIQKIRNSLYNYLMQSSINPYSLLEKDLLLRPPIPKILVTYDSVGILLNYLKELNLLKDFTIICDEMQCLLTDSAFKANTELDTLHNLMELDNRVIFVSATPFSEDYLETMEFFKGMDYYLMDWNSSDKENVTIQYVATNRRPREIIAELIEKYRNQGYFNAKIVDGKDVFSTEGLFYLNRVNEIIKIIQDNKLKPEEVTVVCADNEKNRARLKEVGIKIGHFNSYQDRGKNKPFTFITKASFEGADLYSDTGTTYIFSNPNQKTLALDLSIDITQIIGRNRIATNPFRNDVIFYYRTTNGAIGNVIPSLKNEAEYLDLVADKVKETERLLKLHSTTTDQETLRVLKEGMAKNGYQRSYFDVVDVGGRLKPVMNVLAYSNELRMLDIFRNMYRTKLEVLKNVNTMGFNVADNSTAEELSKELESRGIFEDKMKYFIQYVDSHKEQYREILESILIPYNLKKYYLILGADRIKANGYKEVDLKLELDYRQTQNNIREEIQLVFKRGMKIPYKDAKERLAGIYKKLGIEKAAKATDIAKFIPTKHTKVPVGNGKRKDGIEIL